MSVSDSIGRLARLGPLPCSHEASEEWLAEFDDLASSVNKPITDKDARILLSLFGPDDCFGLAWTLIHLIESAPGWALQDFRATPTNPWHRLLLERRQGLDD